MDGIAGSWNKVMEVYSKVTWIAAIGWCLFCFCVNLVRIVVIGLKFETNELTFEDTNQSFLIGEGKRSQLSFSFL